MKSMTEETILLCTAGSRNDTNNEVTREGGIIFNHVHALSCLETTRGLSILVITTRYDQNRWSGSAGTSGCRDTGSDLKRCDSTFWTLLRYVISKRPRMLRLKSCCACLTLTEERVEESSSSLAHAHQDLGQGRFPQAPPMEALWMLS